MKETNYTYTHTGADYLNDGPPRAEFTPDEETAFVPVNGKSGLLVGAVKMPAFIVTLATMLIEVDFPALVEQYFTRVETPQEADFALVPGDAPVAAFEFCNLHGLWSGK